METPVGRLREFPRERQGIFGASFAEMPSQNQFGVSLQPDEPIRIATGLVVVVPKTGLFLTKDEPPQFINLNVFNNDIPHGGFEKPLAILASRDQSRNDCVPMCAEQPFGAANAHAFDEVKQAVRCLGEGEPHRTKRATMAFGEGSATSEALPTLVSVAVMPEASGSIPANGAEHGGNPFPFWDGLR